MDGGEDDMKTERIHFQKQNIQSVIKIKYTFYLTKNTGSPQF